MPMIDPTPATLRAVAAYLRDACDGPEGGADACERAAGIAEAAGDAAFVEAMRTASREAFICAEHEDCKAIGRVLALVAPGGER